MTLRLNPFINSKPTVCRFPWNPANTAFTALQERSPPIANAIPESGDLQHPHNLPIPVTPQNQNEHTILGREYRPEPQNVVEQQAVNRNVNEGNAQAVVVRNLRRRRARSRDSNASDDSFEPPQAPRRNHGRNERANVQQPQIRITRQ
jgi:hypothetical protein